MPYVTEDNLTDVAMERWKDIPDPRLRQIMQSLIKHLHGFVRDIEPTQAEWAVAIDWLTRTGKLCSQKRQEFILTSDVLGRQHAGRCDQPSPAERRHAQHGRGTVPRARMRRRSRTAATWRRARPASPASSPARVRGLGGEPVAGAMLDLWQTDGEEALRGPARGRWAVDAWPLPQPAGRFLRHPHRGADRLYHSDGRDRGRADGADQHQPHAARAHPLCHLPRPAMTPASPICFRRATNSSRPTSSTA